MRFLLYLLWSLISLLVIVLVSVTLLLTVYKEDVEHKLVSGIENFTKREIFIEGGLSFYFNPWPTFVAKDIKMSNASWSQQPWMLEVKSLSVSLSISDLLHGEINLRSVYADSPMVLIEGNDALNDINWLFKSDREPQPLTFMAEHFRIKEALIENAKVIIRVGRLPHDLDLNTISGQAEYFSQGANIKVVGALDKQPLELDINLDTLRSMFLREPTYIRFSGHQGVTQIQGDGKIQDLLRWQGHEIKLDIQVPSLKDVQSWVESRLIDTPPLLAAANFIQPGRWNSARFDDIDIVSNALDGQAHITGSIAKLKRLEGIELVGEMNYPLASIMRWKGKQSVTDAQLNANMRLFGNKPEALKLEITSAQLQGDGIDFRSAGRIEDLLQSNTEGIPVNGMVDSVALIGEFTDQHWFKTGPLEGRFDIRIKDAKLALENIDIFAFEKRGRIQGILDDITGAQTGQFQFSAKLKPADVKQINELNGLNLSVFEETGIEAKIDMQQTNFSAPEFAMDLRSSGIAFTVTGEVSDLKNLQTQAAEVLLKANTVEAVNRQFSFELPELGEVSATAQLNGNISRYDLENIQGTLLNQHQSYSMLGSIDDLGAEMKSDFTVTSEINSVDNILILLESDIKIPGELHATARGNLTSKSATDWSFKNLLAKLDGAHQGTIKGRVVHFPEKAKYDLVADFRRVDIEGIIDLEAARTLQPEHASVYTEIHKAADADNFSLNNIDGQFSMAGGEASLKLAGDVVDIINLRGISLDLGLSAPELRAVPYLSSVGFRAGIGGVASVKMSGNTDSLDFNITSLKMAETDIRGQLMLKLPTQQAIPYISGQLSSANLDILALLEEDERNRLFSDSPVDLDWIKTFNADIDLRGQKVNGLITQLSDASLSISIKDGVFNAPNWNGALGAGRMTVWLTIDANSDPYDMVVAILGEKIAPEHLNLFGDSEIFRGGEIDVDIGLAGSGLSVAEFMGSAYGKILLELHNSSIKNQNLELFGADLLLSVLDVINPSRKTAEYLPIECGVIHFPVTRGSAVASQGIAIKTDKVTVLGGGVVDFDQEVLELIIKPKARKGLGFSAGTVANIAKITGPFENTKVVLDKSALVQSTAAIGFAVVSGGWSLLVQGLLDRNIANSDVCAQTLAEPNTSFFSQAEDSFREPGDER